jgi:hypothetical protein
MTSVERPPKHHELVGILLAVFTVTTFALAGLFAYSYATYSNDVAVSVHGMVRVTSGYGSPYVVELFTPSPLGSFHLDSVTPVEPLLNNESIAYYSLVVVAGQHYNIGAELEASQQNVPHNCALGGEFIPNCTACGNSGVDIPSGVKDFFYNITITPADCPQFNSTS